MEAGLTIGGVRSIPSAQKLFEAKLTTILKFHSVATLRGFAPRVATTINVEKHTTLFERKNVADNGRGHAVKMGATATKQPSQQWITSKLLDFRL
mmetsp:Transcript_47078/g.56668  ORF Transcript_47078/g.56668 Transcript_47078/m.56668 type:complete len:95 (-) Transcript_47078:243-527(-)